MIEVTAKPKHRQIFEHIHERIVAGQFKAGERLPSEVALSRRFDTSRPTVARAMRDLEAAGLIERRVGSGTYIKNAKVLRSNMFGLLIPGLGSTEIFEPICAEIAREMQGCNYTLLWGHSSADHSEEQNRAAMQLCQQYIDEKVAGVFFAPIELAPQMEETNNKIATLLDNAAIPVVLLDRDLVSYPKRSKFDLVGIDNRRAGCILTQHLLDIGCRTIYFVGRPSSAPTVDARIAGWRDALAEAGICPSASWLCRCDPADESEVQRLLDSPRPEAIVCANDVTAARLMQTLLRLGVSIPGDVRVVGVDDAKNSDLLSVPLTTLRQPCRELGSAAFAAMMQRIARPNMPARDILIECRLVVRESCGMAEGAKSQTPRIRKSPK
jgi:DNA-binding LacI/PurR family transcriptional regulator